MPLFLHTTWLCHSPCCREGQGETVSAVEKQHGFLTRGKGSSPRSFLLGTARGLLLWQQNHCCLCPDIKPPAPCLLWFSQGGCGVSQLP